MLRRPYISVTGISTVDEARLLAEVFQRVLPPNSTHFGMVGYLVMYYMLRWHKHSSKTHPSLDLLPQLL